MKQAIYTRIRTRVDYKKLHIPCPGCGRALGASGDSQNWGNVRRHLNTHIKAGTLTEAAKVSYLKVLGI